MERRKALMLTASIMGGTIIGSEYFLLGCTPKMKDTALFSESNILLLDEIGETILPETDRSPGAKSAEIGLFMTTIVLDCYTKKEQEIFRTGITKLNQLANTTHSSDFLNLTQQQRHDLLVKLDKETRSIIDSEDPIHYFSMMKQLTIWGYFTSKQGATEALRYNPIPGEFKGCIPYNKGDKAWA